MPIVSNFFIKSNDFYVFLCTVEQMKKVLFYKGSCYTKN